MHPQNLRFRTRVLLPIIALLAQFASTCLAQERPTSETAIVPPTTSSDPVRVDKIDPPNWWRPSTMNPIRVLLQGKGLHREGLEIATDSPGLQISNLAASENGHYLFFDLAIDANAKTGDHELKLLIRNETQSSFSFHIAEKGITGHEPQGYSSDDAIYFIMPDRFADGDTSNNDPEKSKGLFDRSRSRQYHGGDLQGIIDHLPYIQSLGMTAIWTTPIYDNNDGFDYQEAYEDPSKRRRPSTGYHGYGAVDMYGVEEHFGDLAKLRDFAAQAHAMNIKVIQDQVANHTGPYHVWANDPPTKTWWNGTKQSHLDNNWQKWTAMNPRATPQTQISNTEGWFINVLPDFNQDDPEVKKYLIQNSLWWIEQVGFDAVRMDTLPHVPRHFWRDWSAGLKKEFPKLTILGELFDYDPILLSYFQGGRTGHDGIDTQIDTLFDFGLYGAIRNAFARGRSVREVGQVFAKDWLYPNSDVLTTFLGVHDMKRFMSEEGATIDGLCLGLTLIMTSRGTPLLYYGDEIAMEGGEDPDNRRDFPGGFPSDPRSAFIADQRTESENRVWKHVARLGELRQQHAALRQGRSFDLVDADQQFAYARVLDQSAVLVVINNDKKSVTTEFLLQSIPLKSSELSRIEIEDALQTPTRLVIENTKATVTLPPRSSAIFLVP